MAVAQGTFQVSTGIIGTTYGVHTLPFRPACVMFMWSGRNGDGIPAAHNLSWGDGFMLENGQNYCESVWEQNAADPFSTGGALWRTACIVRQTGPAATIGRAAFDSMDDDGFDVVITEAFGAEITVTYIAISGMEYNAVEITEPGAAGVLDVSGAGFRPTFMRTYGAGKTAWDTPSAISAPMLGASTGSAADDNGIYTYYRPSGIGTAQGAWYCRRTECIAGISGTGPYTTTVRAVNNGFTDDGCQLDFLERASTRVFVCLFATGRWFHYIGNTRMDLNPFQETGMTWTPEGLVVYAGRGNGSQQSPDCGAETAQDTAHEDDSVNHRSSVFLNRGYATGPASRRSLTIYGGGGTLSNNCGSGQRGTDIYTAINQSPGTITDISAVMDVNNPFTPDTIELVMDDSEPYFATIIYLAFVIGPPILELRSRLTRYIHNTWVSLWEGRNIIRDAQGRDLPMEEVQADNYMHSAAFMFPTPVKHASNLEENHLHYIETISVREGKANITVERESLFSSVMKRLGGS